MGLGERKSSDPPNKFFTFDKNDLIDKSKHSQTPFPMSSFGKVGRRHIMRFHPEKKWFSPSPTRTGSELRLMK